MIALPLLRVPRHRAARILWRFAFAVGLSLLFWSGNEWFGGKGTAVAPTDAAPLVVETVTLVAEGPDWTPVIDLKRVRWRMACPLLVVSGAWIGADGALLRAAANIGGDAAQDPPGALPRAFAGRGEADSAAGWRVTPGAPPADLPAPHRFALVVEAPRTLPCTAHDTGQPWTGVARVLDVVVPKTGA